MLASGVARVLEKTSRPVRKMLPVKVLAVVSVVVPVPVTIRLVAPAPSLIGAAMVRPPELKLWMMRSPAAEPALMPPVVPLMVNAFVPVTSKPPEAAPKVRSNVCRLSVCDAAGAVILSVPTEPMALCVCPAIRL